MIANFGSCKLEHVNNIVPMVKLISMVLCMMPKRVVSAQSLGQYCELFTY